MKYYYLVGCRRSLRLESKASNLNDLCEQVSRRERGEFDGERFAENFDLELEVQLEVVFLVKLSQKIHDAHRPWGGWFEDFALCARFENLGRERHDVEQLLLANLVGFDDQRLDIQIYLLMPEKEKLI